MLGTRNTGLIKEALYSERDYTYETVCGGNVTPNGYAPYFCLPENRTGTQKDQKDIGACVAMTISSIAEAYWNDVLGETGEHSEGFVYGKFRLPNSTQWGLVVSIAMEKWVELGTLPKSNFDILMEMPEMKAVVDKYPELLDIAKKYKLSAFARLRSNGYSTRDDQIKDALLRYDYGLVAIDDRHCMQLVGWDDDNHQYILKDSYNNGFKKYDKDDIEQVWLPIFEPIKLPFTDIDENSWSYPAIRNLYLSGMINGTSETTMEPKRNITREEVFYLVDKLMKENQKTQQLLNKVTQEKEALIEQGYKVL